MGSSTSNIIYRNGRAYSPGAAQASALMVQDGRITWIGDSIDAPLRPGADQIDLAGALVTPAFVDAHVHLTATGLGLIGLDLSSMASRDAVLGAVAAQARSSAGRPILAGGWDETHWPDANPPRAAELDRASYGGLVYLARVDAHSAVVSSALLAAVPDIQQLRGYRPDGLLAAEAHDAARAVALAALPTPQLRAAQQAALAAAAAQGIGCVHEMAGPVISSERDLLSAIALGTATDQVEVIGYWGELFGIEAARDLGAAGAAGDLFLDGSLGSHTAALREPYTDRPQECGRRRYEVADIAEHLRRCTAAGLQGGFHAIGDAAVDQLLDAVELLRAGGDAAAGAGHRIEHALLVEDPARLAASGLFASLQPAFEATWGGPRGMYASRLGAPRLDRLARFAELAAHGVPLAFGSDAPVTPLAPWAAVRAAAYPHDPAAAISPRSAFGAHTRGGWRAAGRAEAGVLSPGADATFAIWDAGELGVVSPDERVTRWSTDPRAAVPGLPDLAPGGPLPRCLRTVRRGVPIFDAGALSRR